MKSFKEFLNETQDDAHSLVKRMKDHESERKRVAALPNKPGRKPTKVHHLMKDVSVQDSTKISSHKTRGEAERAQRQHAKKHGHGSYWIDSPSKGK